MPRISYHARWCQGASWGRTSRSSRLCLGCGITEVDAPMAEGRWEVVGLPGDAVVRRFTPDRARRLNPALWRNPLHA